ncbi:zinc transporter ZntB [Arenibacterium sp. CAU 1754]
MTINFAYRCHGSGQADPITVTDQPAETLASVKEGFVWVHLARPDPSVAGWLQVSGLPDHVVDVLDAPETRPRCTVFGNGILLNLRGVNLTEGADPEDMVSLRLWVTAGLVVTVQRRRLRAIEDVRDACDRNVAPKDAGELVARLALRLADRAEPVVADLNERIDDLEAELADTGTAPSRGNLAEVRRVSIMLRRFMFPQRDALSTLAIEDMDWLHPMARDRLREATERVTRLAEALDAIRDRAEVVHDQIMDMRAEITNRQMLILSVVAAVFLPLGLLTGLLGINVGGIPGTDNPLAFWFVCGALVVIALFLLWLFRRWGMLGK